MKHFLLLAGLALATGLGVEAQAQAQARQPLPQSAYTRMRDSVLAPLDKARNPTGILYDRVVSLANLDHLARHPDSEQSISSAAHFQQAYFELYTAAYSPMAPAFPIRRPAIGAAIDAAAATSFGPEKANSGGPQTLPIGLLDYSFAVLDPQAVKAGTLRKQDGLYQDGKGSPYQLRSLLLASPLLDKVAPQVRLLLPASLLLGNTGRQVQTVSITSPEAGLSAQLQPGQSVLATLPVGRQQLTFTVRFTNGTRATCRATVLVEQPAQARPTAEIFTDYPTVAGLEWTDYDGYRTYGHIEVRVLFNHPQSKQDKRARRPVFVLDGFDPGNKRDMVKLQTAYEAFNALLKTPGQERDLVLLNFPTTLRRVTLPNGSVDYRDVDGGADYIERNALAFTAALHFIRNTSQANPAEKVSVIGPSMGGLITRYALAQMERNYAAAPPSNPLQSIWYTNVDTWISFDAPHQGANIPLGDQMFVKYFAAKSPPAEAALGRLQSVAARQMLLVQSNTVLGRNLHVRFMQNLLGNGLAGSQGYPQTMRRVALANGSGDGLLQYQMGQPLQQTINLKVIKPILWGEVDAVKAQVYYGPGANGSGVVFSAQSNPLVDLFSDLSSDENVFQYADSKGNYDLAPGGRYQTQGDIETFTMASDAPYGTYYKFSNTRPSHAFIPTVSAIDYNYRALASNFTGQQQYSSPYTKLSDRALRCNNETPFDVYYLSPTNTDHVSLNTAQGQWVARELFGVNQPPTFAGANPAPSVCPGAQVTLSIDGCRMGQAVNSYNWSVSGPAVLVRTNSTTDNGQGSQVAVRVTGAGPITVSVVDASAGRLPSPAATYSFTSAVSAGAGLAIELTEYETCSFNTTTVRALGDTPGPYYWSTQAERNGSGVGAIRYFTTFSPELSVLVRSDNVRVTLQAPDRCSGQLQTATATTVYVSLDSGCGVYGYSISPVPSDGYLRVETKRSAAQPVLQAQTLAPGVAERSSSAPDAPALTKPLPLTDEDNPHIYSADLYDGRGQKVGSASTRAGKLAIPTDQLATGLYHLVIMRGGQRTSHNIPVRH